LRRHTARLRQATALPARPPAPAPKKVASWILTPPGKLTAAGRTALAQITGRCPELAVTSVLVRDFAVMLCHRGGCHLEAWARQAEASPVPELRGFATGLRKDWAAVTAGLTLPYSSGIVEGHVNRIILWNQSCQIDSEELPRRVRELLGGCGGLGRGLSVKKYILFDHDGVLVDTEFWYYKAGERALADVGLVLGKDQYLRNMNLGLGTWAQARAAGIDEQVIGRLRGARNDYYQEYLRTEAIEIDGVIEALAELSQHARMAIVTTAKRADFELIHEKRRIRQFMDFVLVREDYERAKPHPEPYLAGLKRFGAAREEALVVEDSPRGLKSAVAAGIDCAIVRSDFTHSPDFPEASYRIGALIELRGIILRDQDCQIDPA
jgi:HAD superfamily hydrolase (TIGR01509 family)